MSKLYQPKWYSDDGTNIQYGEIPDGECRAYKEAKANNCAYIVEDGWIVRVYADDTRERIKYLGETEVEIKTDKVKL